MLLQKSVDRILPVKPNEQRIDPEKWGSLGKFWDLVTIPTSDPVADMLVERARLEPVDAATVAPDSPTADDAKEVLGLVVDPSQRERILHVDAVSDKISSLGRKLGAVVILSASLVTAGISLGNVQSAIDDGIRDTHTTPMHLGGPSRP